MTFIRTLVVASFLGLLLSSAARGGLIYTIETRVVGPSTVQPGQQVTVELFAKELATNNETLQFTSPGLASFGPFSIDYDAAPNVFSTSEANITVNPLFDVFSTVVVNGTDTSVELSGLASIPITAGGGTSFELSLATLNFTAVGTPGQSVTFGFTPGTFGDLFFGNSLTSPPVVFQTATISIAAVPEPSSLVLTALVSSALLFRRRRVISRNARASG
jgi:hypothetical protein